jgi:hypothetical protein
MRKSCLALIAALAAPIPGWAADQGEVVWVDVSCNHFIAKVGDEFGIYNWRSGGAPAVGDRLEGDLTSMDAGSREIHNTNSAATNSVYMLAMGAKLHAMIHSTPVQCKERWRSSTPR